jgi:predicted RNase H-like nuclease (RuvC/YqgF family)
LPLRFIGGKGMSDKKTGIINSYEFISDDRTRGHVDSNNMTREEDGLLTKDKELEYADDKEKAREKNSAFSKHKKNRDYEERMAKQRSYLIARIEKLRNYIEKLEEYIRNDEEKINKLTSKIYNIRSVKTYELKGNYERKVENIEDRIRITREKIREIKNDIYELQCRLSRLY